MKSILKVLFIFLAFVVSLALEPLDLHAQEISSFGYIQKSPYESLEVVSNNIFGEGYFTAQDKNNNTSLDNTHYCASILFKKNTNIENNSLIYRVFIHNLSTNSKKVQSIRAP